jgi:hypothetical protein
MTKKRSDLNQILSELIEDVKTLPFVNMKVTKDVDVPKLRGAHDVSLLVDTLLFRVVASEKLHA